MTEGCPVLKLMPEKSLKQKETEDNWGVDSDVYNDCRERRNALMNFYRNRDRALRADK